MDEMVFYKEEETALYIRATGHITANSCSLLKDKVFEVLEDEANKVSGIYVDLSQCEYMDSTFMGLLAGFNKRMLRLGRKAIVLYKVSETCQKLLKTIGITKLVTFSEETPQFPAMMESISPSENASPEFILDSHNNLIELSEENEKRFSTLRSILQSTINGKNSENESKH